MDVSVVMPMRNAAPYVARAIESVLSERAVDLELVVVDDGSSDNSRELVLAIGDPRVRLVDGPRRGIAACMNTGLAAARGEVLMRCDSDDRYPVGRIARQMTWLAEHPAHVAVCGPFCTIDDRDRLVSRLWDQRHGAVDDIAPELHAGTMRTHLCTYAIRRSALERTGGFREYFETAEDVDFALRLADAGPIGFVPGDTYFYRLHDTSVTHRQHSARSLFFEERAREFQRQRAAGGRDALMDGNAPAPPARAAASTDSAAVHVQSMLIGEAWRALDAHSRRRGLSHAWRAVCAHPRRSHAWMQLLKILLAPRRKAASQ